MSNAYGNPYYTQAHANGGYPAASTSASGYNMYAPVAAPSVAGPSMPSGWTPVVGPSVPTGYGPIGGGGYNPMGGPNEYDMSLAQQQSIYTPEMREKMKPVAGETTKPQGSKARTTVLRKGGGEVWEDQTLMEWDPAHFRLFIGDLDPALSDDLFVQAFSGVRFPSFVKAKIIRDKHTNKGKGYGFVSYSDPEDFLKAWKEMNGKYVGTRPVKISKATAGVSAVNIGNRKAAMLDAKKVKKTGTVPYEKSKAAEAEGMSLDRRGTGGYGPQRDRKSYIRR